MYILKNALKNLTRNTGRTILTGFIILLIVVSCCVSLSIRQAANRARQEGLNRQQITAQIALDRQSMMSAGGGDRESIQEALQNAQELSLEEMQHYASASSVKEFTYTVSVSFGSVEDGDVQPVDTSTTTSSSSQQQGGQQFGMTPPSGDDGGPQAMGGMGNQGDFTLIGYSSYAAMTAFQNSTASITDGSMFAENTEDAVCVISDELAAYNSLSVGDTITLNNPNNEDETYTFTVSGIYHNSESTQTSGGGMRGFSASSDPANQIYTSYPALKAVTAASSANATVETDDTTGQTKTSALREQLSGTYAFADYASYEQFTQEVKALGLSDSYTVSSSDVTAFEQSLLPLENLSKFATTFFFLILSIGGGILVLLTVLSIRERKYEIGVLTAIGMTKGKVCAQFLCELFAMTLLAVVLGTGIGAAVSVPTTNALLQTQLTSQQQQEQQRQSNFGPGQAPDGIPGGTNSAGTQSVTTISSATDWKVVAELMGIGFLLTGLSGAVASVFVMRYDPMTILSNRD